MAVLVIAEPPGMTSEQDDAMVDALDLEGNPPSGCRSRMSGPTEDGWRIVTLWDSRDHFEEFLESRLKPALQGTGRSLPDLTYWEIEKVRTFERVAAT
jgi:hypothetical protein